MRYRMFGRRAGVTLAAAATVAALGATVRPANAVAAVAPTAAATSTDATHAAQVLQADLDAARTRHGLPGMIGLVRDGDSVHFASSGVGNKVGQVAADPKARYRIGSITKTFTAAAVLLLAGEGVLSLDDTVDRWLPGLIAANGNDGKTITIRQLLNHTSGLPEVMNHSVVGWSYRANANPYQRWDKRRLVELAAGMPRLAEPGTKFEYSNTGYIVADLIVQEATGRSMAAEVTERIIEPLGLTDTTFPEDDPRMTGNHLRGYNGIRDVTVSDVGTAGAAADIVSTLEDVADFTRALATGELLAPAQMADLQKTVPTGHPEGITYGLGIEVATPCGTVWSHNGAVLGYATYYFTSPDGTKQAIAATNNHFPAGSSPSPKAVMDAAEHAYCELAK